MSSQTQISTPTSEQPPQVSVVIPAYNEEGNIYPLDEELQAVLNGVTWSAEVIWVNDGSADETDERIDTLAAVNENTRAIHLRTNSGQSAALQAGFDAAAGEVVVAMDADRQNDPADIPRLVDRLEDGYDCVSGNRADRHDPLAKRVPSNMQTRLTSQMCPEVSDFGCTLKAYRARALDDITLRGEHHRYIPAKLASRGYELTEVDVNHRERDAGETKYGVGRLLRGFLDAVYHLLMHRWGARPIHLFGTVGLMLFSLGGVLGGHMLVKRLMLYQPIGQHVPRLIAIAVLVISGLLVFSLGVLFEVLAELRYRDERTYQVQEVVE